MKKLSDLGFTTVEYLLVLITLVVIGISSYFVANHINKKSETSLTLTTSTSPKSTNKNSTTPPTKSSTTSPNKSTTSSNSSTSNNDGSVSTSEINIAIMAMYSYCNASKAQGDVCTFGTVSDARVEDGIVIMNGGSTTPDGYADDGGAYFVKKVNSNWTVINVTQSCFSRDIAIKYSVPLTLDFICSQ